MGPPVPTDRDLAVKADSFRINLNPLPGESKPRKTGENVTLIFTFLVVYSCIYPSKTLGLDGHE